MTAVPSSQRTALLGLTGGAVALVLVGGFAIGLPKAADDASTSALPDKLPMGLTAVEVLAQEQVDSKGDQASQAQQFLDEQGAIQGSAVDALKKQYDAPVELRAYQTADLQSQLTITEIGAPAGPFLPQGPVPDPKTYGYARGAYSLEKIGDAICSLAWSAPVPEGQAIDDTEKPSSVYCQLAAGDVTYYAIGNGFTGQEAVDVLDSLAS